MESTPTNPVFYLALGRAIQVHRARLGMDRKTLAKRAGVSYPYLSEIENGKKRPSSSAVLAIAEALGLRPSELLEGAEGLAEESPQVLDVREPPGEVAAAEMTRASARPPAPMARMASTAALSDLSDLEVLPDRGVVSPAPLASSVGAVARRSWFRSRPPGGPVASGSPAPPAPRQTSTSRSREDLMTELLDLAADLPEDDVAQLLELARRFHR